MGVPGRHVDAKLTTHVRDLAADASRWIRCSTLARRVNPDVAREEVARLRRGAERASSAQTGYLPSLALEHGLGRQRARLRRTRTSRAARLERTLSRLQTQLRARVRLAPRAAPACRASRLRHRPAVRRRRLARFAREQPVPVQVHKAPFSLGATLSLPIFNGFSREAERRAGAGHARQRRLRRCARATCSSRPTSRRRISRW